MSASWLDGVLSSRAQSWKLKTGLKSMSLSTFPTHLTPYLRKKKKYLCTYDRSPEWARVKMGVNQREQACVSTHHAFYSFSIPCTGLGALEGLGLVVLPEPATRRVCGR